ncbi:hypothetical protein [Fluviispira sanaruensis]|uniref:Uncharacterized protein n=1 Tax=Fluviispira sanaruensis TaxID=2493639 RepID=A0A4P2VRB1_FLUSA|nr:hypothetical protein [Fluviispira sanaruensis]BBH54739.1 hypothetical protein JCM31447_32130 [Fluviispira sanaruensis]
MKKTKKKNPYFKEIIAGINEAIEFEKGNINLRTKTVNVTLVKKVKATEIVESRKHLSYRA